MAINAGENLSDLPCSTLVSVLYGAIRIKKKEIWVTIYNWLNAPSRNAHYHQSVIISSSLFFIFFYFCRRVAIRASFTYRRVLLCSRPAVSPFVHLQVQSDGWRSPTTPLAPRMPQRLPARWSPSQVRNWNKKKKTKRKKHIGVDGQEAKRRENKRSGTDLSVARPLYFPLLDGTNNRDPDKKKRFFSSLFSPHLPSHAARGTREAKIIHPPSHARSRRYII